MIWDMDMVVEVDWAILAKLSDDKVEYLEAEHLAACNKEATRAGLVRIISIIT